MIKELLSKLRCGVCGFSYVSDSAKVLGHTGDLWFLRVWCSECSGSSVVVVMVREEESPIAFGDLTEEEYARFTDAPSISADDVLEIHEWLERPCADISGLLGRGDG